jgi:hypothetical protein
MVAERPLYDELVVTKGGIDSIKRGSCGSSCIEIQMDLTAWRR